MLPNIYPMSFIFITCLGSRNTNALFVSRIGQLIDVAGEKTTETSIQKALAETMADSDGLTLVDYTCTTNALVQLYGKYFELTLGLFLKAF